MADIPVVDIPAANKQEVSNMNEEQQTGTTETTNSGEVMEINELIEVGVYSGIGIVVFALAFFVMVKISPFSVQKEIEDDQNISLGILMGSVIIGLAMIISAVVGSG